MVPRLAPADFSCVSTVQLLSIGWPTFVSIPSTPCPLHFPTIVSPKIQTDMNESEPVFNPVCLPPAGVLSVAKNPLLRATTPTPLNICPTLAILIPYTQQSLLSRPRCLCRPLRAPRVFLIFFLLILPSNIPLLTYCFVRCPLAARPVLELSAPLVRNTSTSFVVFCN